MIDGARIYHAATHYLGVPFRHKGRSRAGLDCLGLVLVAARDAGLAAPDFWNYGTFPDAQALLYALEGAAAQVQQMEAQAGDLFLFSFRYAKPSHFALWDGADRIIHAYEQARKVVVHRFNRAWGARLHSCWRLEGVA